MADLPEKLATNPKNAEIAKAVNQLIEANKASTVSPGIEARLQALEQRMRELFG